MGVIYMDDALTEQEVWDVCHELRNRPDTVEIDARDVESFMLVTRAGRDVFDPPAWVQIVTHGYPGDDTGRLWLTMHAPSDVNPGPGGPWGPTEPPSHCDAEQAPGGPCGPAGPPGTSSLQPHPLVPGAPVIGLEAIHRSLVEVSKTTSPTT